MNESVSVMLFVYGLAIVVAMGGAVLIKLVVGALAWSDRGQPAAAQPATPAPPAAIAPGAIPAHHLVAIAAAAYAMVGPHRVLHIGHTASGRGWSSEGRMAQHTSHLPH